MPEQAWTQCPDCRWTGPTSDLQGRTGARSCPACGARVVIE